MDDEFGRRPGLGTSLYIYPYDYEIPFIVLQEHFKQYYWLRL